MPHTLQILITLTHPVGSYPTCSYWTPPLIILWALVQVLGGHRIFWREDSPVQGSSLCLPGQFLFFSACSVSQQADLYGGRTWGPEPLASGGLASKGLVGGHRRGEKEHGVQMPVSPS